jgi:hypothetical protein
MIEYFNCRHTARLLSDRLERSLSCFEWVCLGVHLLACEPCCRFGRAIGYLRRLLPQAPCDAQLSPEARERIRLALEQAAKEE